MKPALGFRVWSYSRDSGILALCPVAYSNHHWKPGVNRAFCAKGPGGGWRSHAAPAKGCTCGLHIYHKVETCNYFSGSLLHGVVIGWGKIALHPDGFRAQYARILALGCNDDTPMVATEIAQRYRVPLIPTDKLQSFGDRFGKSYAEEYVIPAQEPLAYGIPSVVLGRTTGAETVTTPTWGGWGSYTTSVTTYSNGDYIIFPNNGL